MAKETGNEVQGEILSRRRTASWAQFDACKSSSTWSSQSDEPQNDRTAEPRADEVPEERCNGGTEMAACIMNIKTVKRASNLHTYT